MSSYAHKVASLLLSCAHLSVPNVRALRVAPPGALPELLPFSHPISGFRDRTVEDRGITVLYQPQGSDPPRRGPLSPRSPSESYLEKIFPFAAQPRVRQLYRGEATGAAVNVGLFLEDFDTFAADVAARHCGLEDKRLVTASVERLLWLPAAFQSSHQQTSALCRDMSMVGQVTWVGKSSMEVTVQLLTHEPALQGLVADVSRLDTAPPSQQLSQSPSHACSSTPHGFTRRGLLAMARFLMAARDLDMKSSMAVPPLLLSTSVELDMFDQGQSRQRERSLRRAHGGRSSTTSRTTAVPLVWTDPSTVAHGVGIDWSSFCSSCARAAARQPVSASQVSTAAPVCAPQAHDSSSAVFHICLSRYEDRNTTDTLFGGQALRLGYEVARVAAVRHAGSACDLLGLEEVEFHEPIPMGAAISVNARIMHVEGAEVHVAVHAAYAARADVLDGDGHDARAARTSHTLMCIFGRRDANATSLPDA